MPRLVCSPLQPPHVLFDGAPPIRKLQLSDREKSILRQARAICDGAAGLLGTSLDDGQHEPDTDCPFYMAGSWLGVMDEIEQR